MKKLICNIPWNIQMYTNNQHRGCSFTFIFGCCGFIKFKVNQPMLIASSYLKLKMSGPSVLFNTFHTLIYKYYLWTLDFNERILKLNGVGFKFKIYKNVLLLLIGFSHLIKIRIPLNIYIKLKKFKILKLVSIDLNFLNLFLYRIKKIKKIDIYKGKGILLQKEKIKLKEGKKSSF